LPTRLKLDVWYVRKIETSNCFEAWGYEVNLIWWTVRAIVSTALGKYPKWLEDYLVGLK